MEEVEIGKKYLYRAFPNLGLADAKTIRVLNVFTYGDGKKVVRFRHNGIFPIESDVYIEEFMKNVVIE